MTNITPASSSGVSRVERTAPAEPVARPGEDRAGGVRRDADRVEFSLRARALATLRELPPVRSEIVDRVRSEIASGTYLTEDRIDLAIDALAGELTEDARLDA